MNKVFLFFILAIVVLGACTETDVEKTVLPYSHVTGEYAVLLKQTHEGNDDVYQEHNIRIYNSSVSTDSLWIEDPDFFTSKVRVKWDGINKFSIVNGEDIALGEIVNIVGEVFPEKDSVHIVWTYLQPAGDDYVVVADGALYTGLDN